FSTFKTFILDQPGGKVTVIGGGDLGMACVTSILAKCHVDKLVFIDVAESSTKGGSTDLEIFSLPKVTVSAGEHLRRRLGSSRNRRPHLVG
uniref:Lactate/malate dehydrogenase N-terminal domain-containing protein n=1 Tax=Oryzias latipes TaxID=8090 RepID=A0A3B3I3K2_ORYLA